MPRVDGLLLLFLMLLPMAGAIHAQQPDEVDFSLHVEPILSDRCYKCHGPDENQRQAGLRLDIEAAAKEYAIVEGDPDASELISRISSHDDDRMPPPDSKLSLSEQEIQLIREWIAAGAPWRKHWAFEPPARASPPAVDHPWVHNEIDSFILARMTAKGLDPNQRASKEKLIRRVTFDITGLPPTITEIDAFLSDHDAGAYERLVDQLLDSPRYGERMASAWLDVARYSDTYGYQVDRDRFVWPWRDWVIRAFNANMRYDQFLTEQLAGDLLPGATDDQILATTFNRLHPQKVEGGSVPEEFRVEYVADRAQTFATAFLGLTLECARCHDHKFDPISQREYYQLFAYFNNIDEAGLYSFFTSSVPTPALALRDADAKRALALARRRVEESREKLQQLRISAKERFAKWRREQASKTAVEIRSNPLPGQLAHLDFEGIEAVGNRVVPGRSGLGSALQLSGDDEFPLQVGNFRRDQAFTISLWLKTGDRKERAVVFHRSRAWTDAASRGYELLIEDGKLRASLIHFWPGNAISVKTKLDLPIDQWVHVAVVYDGQCRADGLRLYVDGRLADVEVVRDELTKNITGGGGDNLAIGARFRDRGFTGGLVDEFRVFDRQLSAIEVLQLVDGRSLVDALADASDELNPVDLTEYYLLTQDADYKDGVNALATAIGAVCELQNGTQEIMVMRELAKPRSAFVLQRGLYSMPGEPVNAATPAVFTTIPSPPQANRLGLAEWATHPQHPLTSRIAVNYLWQLCFGRGLVPTPEDFGSQGMRPTHPLLLDWLAVDFVEHGWDIKRTMKQIVMSATYRQSTSASPADRQIDPENLWFSRAPSYRMTAEMIRDNALAVSGLLVEQLGGPPAKPYELQTSFAPIKPDEGEGLYRRSLYTYWKRTGPAPVMMTLDASTRDVCRMRRESTSTPLQALVILNGPQFVEASRVLAHKQLEQHRSDPQAAIESIFRLLTSRKPDPQEKQLLWVLYEGQMRHFEAHPSAANDLLQVGQKQTRPIEGPATLAALTVVASTLMNHDECMMKQ